LRRFQASSFPISASRKKERHGKETPKKAKNHLNIVAFFEVGTIIIIEIQKEVIIDEKGIVTRIGIAHDGLSDRRGGGQV
jgi:hypothetical protein